MHFLISRTDAIGDVVLTLPLCTALKQTHPDSFITFMASAYTLPVVEACQSVDATLDYTLLKTLPFDEQVALIKAQHVDRIIHVFPVKEIAKLMQAAAIPERLGTISRPFHWRSCNRLVPLFRKNSPYHEAELNLRLARRWLSPQPWSSIGSLYHLKPQTVCPPVFGELKAQFANRLPILLHPLSKGSARNWPIEHWMELAIKLINHPNYFPILTGTAAEATLLPSAFTQTIPNLMGQLSLAELIAVISESAGLVAASTGPLHLAAALDRIAIGIYPPIPPLWPKRWRPLGKHAFALTTGSTKCKTCVYTSNDKRTAKPMPICVCMANVTPEIVLNTINKTKNID